MAPPREIVPAGPGAQLPAGVRAMLDPTDTVRLAVKPSPWFIVLRSFDAVAFALLALGLVAGMTLVVSPGVWGTRAAAFALLIVVLRLIWSALEWACRWYVLTDARAIRVAGVVHRVTSDVPRDAIRAVALDEPFFERLLGLGTIGFATAGTGAYEVVWSMLARPQSVMSMAKGSSDPAPTPAGAVPVTVEVGSPNGTARPRPVVIGIVGGVGSGKSTVARAFERLGCMVSDSDREAAAVLTREDVKHQLVEWWGPDVLTTDGGVDRSAVAMIVFADDAERRRLEGLVHPLLHETRRALIARAGRLGAPGVVIDAPLLFEAGVDRECDAVVFVETPRQARLERVRAARGWDETELDRREKAQLPLERKRERSDYVVINAGHAEEIDHQVGRVFQAIRNERSPGDGR
ncbi:MAG: hypothetical protein DHS20C14_12400 [Phycisphaeraceae bacterium]|nr:MAG: hypothetical protein DHS20C14_12400 [Phycisphaeraceae bacterium]